MAVFAVAGVLRGDDDPQEVFKSLYGEKIAAVTATAARNDDVALAKQLLDGAKVAANNPPLLALMCQAVYDLGTRHADGYVAAGDAMRLLMDAVPAQKAAARGKLLDLYNKQIVAATKENKSKFGDEAIALLATAATEEEKQGRLDEAAAVCRRAIAVAASVNSTKLPGLRARAAALAERDRQGKRINQLKEKLLEDARDAASAEELVRLLAIDRNDPAAASAYLSFLPDGPLKTNVALAARPVAELSEAQCLTLGEWYHGLAMKEKTATHLWSRAESSLARYLERHATIDLSRTKAELLLKETRLGLAKAAMGADPLVVHPGITLLEAKYGLNDTWIDIVDRLSPHIKDDRLVFYVGASTAGQDPVPFKRKQLKLKYRQGDKTVTLAASDGDIVGILSPKALIPGNDLHVIEAGYGLEGHWAFPTETLRRLIKDSRLEVGINPPALGVGDPVPGNRKTLYVVYQWRGKVQMMQLSDGDLLQLPPK